MSSKRLHLVLAVLASIFGSEWNVRGSGSPGGDGHKRSAYSLERLLVRKHRGGPETVKYDAFGIPRFVGRSFVDQNFLAISSITESPESGDPSQTEDAVPGVKWNTLVSALRENSSDSITKGNEQRRQKIGSQPDLSSNTVSAPPGKVTTTASRVGSTKTSAATEADNSIEDTDSEQGGLLIRNSPSQEGGQEPGRPFSTETSTSRSTAAPTTVATTPPAVRTATLTETRSTSTRSRASASTPVPQQTRQAGTPSSVENGRPGKERQAITETSLLFLVDRDGAPRPATADRGFLTTTNRPSLLQTTAAITRAAAPLTITAGRPLVTQPAFRRLPAIEQQLSVPVGDIGNFPAVPPSNTAPIDRAVLAIPPAPPAGPTDLGPPAPVGPPLSAGPVPAAPFEPAPGPIAPYGAAPAAQAVGVQENRPPPGNDLVQYPSAPVSENFYTGAPGNVQSCVCPCSPTVFVQRQRERCIGNNCPPPQQPSATPPWNYRPTPPKLYPEMAPADQYFGPPIYGAAKQIRKEKQTFNKRK